MFDTFKELKMGNKLKKTGNLLYIMFVIYCNNMYYFVHYSFEEL